MLAGVKNHDFIYYQLRNQHYAQLTPSLKKSLHQLSKDIIHILKSNKPIEGQLAHMLSQLFNLKIKAIQWLSENKDLHYLKLQSEVSNHFEELEGDKRMEVLKENILFALRCNQRIIESLLNSGELSEKPAGHFHKLPDINYQQFLASLAFAIPDEETVQKITDWINASLQVEFVILATDLMRTEKIKVSDKLINELSFLIADAAQEYAALAITFGLLKGATNQHAAVKHSVDKSFVAEQQYLADIGIEDFDTNFTEP